MRDESGWSVIELMLVAVLLAIVLGGTLNLLDTTAKIAPQEQERAHAVREAQVGLARMTRELRQAVRVNASANPALIISVDTPVAGVRRTVTYDCTGTSPTVATTKACRRSQSGGLQNEVVIDRVTNSTVFTADGNDYFKVRIEVPASGERQQGLRHKIVLDDGFFMRNLQD